jgi:hypothetical protein
MAFLRQLITALGPIVQDAHLTPVGLDSAVRDVVVYDALDQPLWHRDDLVLGVGIGPAEGSLLAELAGAGAAGLLAKEQPTAGDDLVAQAEAAGLNLLVVPRAASWTQLVLLLRTLVAQDRVPGPDAGIPAGPLGDLFAVANLVAELVGAPITIEDNRSQLLAFSSHQEGTDAARTATILGRQVPEAYLNVLRRLGTFQRLRTATEPIFVDSGLPEVSSRMIVAMRAGGELLGSVWAVTDKPFDAARALAFADAARLAAVHVLHNRLSSDVDRRHQSDLLAAVLRGGTVAADAARHLGITGEAFRVVAAGLRTSDGADLELPLARLWHALSMHLSATHRGAATARVGSAIYSVIPTAPDAGRSLESVRRLVAAVHGRLESELRERTVISIGGLSSAFAELPRSRGQADVALRVLRLNPSGRAIAEIGELKVQVMLLRLADLESVEGDRSDSRLKVVEEYDRRHGSSYLKTLRTHLSSFGDPTLAAGRLGIHTNTLRYRLRRLNELFSIDVGDEDERLVLMLELRLERLASP